MNLVELKLSLKKHDSKNDPNLKSKNANLRSQLSQETSKSNPIKIEHVELKK